MLRPITPLPRESHHRLPPINCGLWNQCFTLNIIYIYRAPIFLVIEQDKNEQEQEELLFSYPPSSPFYKVSFSLLCDPVASELPKESGNNIITERGLNHLTFDF